MPDDREQAIEQIVAAARGARPLTPRWLWIVAGVIGVGCAIAFAFVMLGGGDSARVAPSMTHGPGTVIASSSRLGFASGIAMGVALGIAIGLAIGRSRAQLVRDHSSRNRP